MQTEIFITSDVNGNVITQSKNNEIYYVKLIQYRMEVNRRGFVNRKSYVTFLKGTLEDLRSLGIENKKTLPGNIVVEESTIPFDNDPTRNLKKAGNTGIVLYTEDGEPIYRQTFWDQTGMLKDILVAHGNGNEIKKHISKKKFTKPRKEKKISELKADASSLLIDFDSMEKEEIKVDSAMSVSDQNEAKEEIVNYSECNEEVVEETEEIVIPEVIVEEEVIEMEEEDEEEEYLFEL